MIENLQRVAEQCAVIGLELNVNKSMIFVFGRSRKEQLTDRSLAKAISPTVTRGATWT